MHTLNKYLIALLTGILVGCADVTSQKNQQEPSEEFKEYWYAGKAELNHYKLEQARYGELHEGDAVLIFVTEDFRTDRQVKYEGGNREHVTSVLKLNFNRKFWTGLYPYSMMTSVFTPVSNEATIKVTTTSQEWCGHTFSQLNLRGNTYNGRLFSYFQDEGDREFTIDATLLEDEVWAKIRIDPSELPTGNIDLIPGTQYLRFKHRECGAEKANAVLESIKDPELSNKPLSRYSLTYQDFKRVLSITFETDFPHAIVAWEEQSEAGFGSSEILTTRAIRTHELKSPYWEKHDAADSVLRQKFGFK